MPAGVRTALVGPSGAGKTMLLRAVAGLEPLRSGEVLLAGERIDQRPSHRRRIAIVFQEPRLLPHLSVVDNAALPLRAAGLARGEGRARARERLDEVGLAGLADRPIAGLSGGEQQRVALARALCAEPQLLMLDEPLVAVDPQRRESLRRLIARIQEERSLTTLIVTHDRAEAAELGQRIALMLEGTIVQDDEPAALFERPRSAAVARFFGMTNIVRGVVHGGRLRLGDATIEAPGPDGPATLGIRPEHVRLDPGAPLRARVRESDYLGTYVRVVLAVSARELEAHVPADVAPAPGDRAGVELPRDRLWRIPEPLGEPVEAS